MEKAVHIYRISGKDVPFREAGRQTENGTIFFCDEATLVAFDAQTRQDKENAFKNFFKRWPRMYELAIYLIVPILFSGRSARSFAKKFGADGLILNVGSGSKVIHPNAVNVDVFPFPNVDVVAQAGTLPFPDATFDAVCSEQVLEHVPKPWEMARELLRVTKPGGYIYTAVPFMFPLHPSPKDYSRWTLDGLRSLFEGTEEIEAGFVNGPISGMLANMAYGLSVLFSFGITPVRKILLYVFMPILSPFKLLDYVYTRLPGAEDTSASPYLIVRKRV